MSDFDTKALRNAFGQYMTGVTVVTTRSKTGEPCGFTANSFTSVSMNPPLLLVCPGRFLSTYDTFATCGAFAVSILAEGQEQISNVFAGFKGDRFAQVMHHADCHDIPVIDAAVATFSCKTHKVVEAGDHAILIGEVIDFSSSEKPGLGYHGGQYFSLGLERAARAQSTRKMICGVIAHTDDAVLLERTESGFRPPQVHLQGDSDLEDSLARAMGGRGIDVDMGPVYSVFEDPHDGTHYAFLLASAKVLLENEKLPSGRTIEAIPKHRLPALTYTQVGVKDMMCRFSQEAQTNAFMLYVGDVQTGSVHRLFGKG